MYYCLNKGFSLCSYKSLPYGLRNAETNTIKFLADKDRYLLLYKCNGKYDLDALSLSQAQKDFLDSLVREGVLSVFPERHPLEGPIPGKLYPNEYRKSIQWSITGKCNYRCRHCFQSAPEGILGQPDLDTILHMIDQFEACGISEVSLTGGEPLIRSDFFDIVDALIGHGIRISMIYSNGALISEKLISQLEQRELKPAFQISFDGTGWHDWMRRVPGAEKAALHAIELLKAHGFSVSCAMVLSRENTSSILETVRLLESLGVSAVKLQRCFPQGEWKNETAHYLSDDELLELYRKTLGEICRAGIHMPVQMEGVYAINWSAEKGKYTIHNLYGREITPERYETGLSCGQTLSNFFVGPNGAVVPCMNMCSAAVEEIFPNLLKTPLQEILTDSSYLKYSCAKIRDVVEHNPECKACSFVSRCGGGQCRANAIGDKSTDYYCKDIFVCYIFKSGWAEKLKEAAQEAIFC